MNYSIIMPYYKRSKHLFCTLLSFKHHYGDRKDFEVVIIEDVKNLSDATEHKLLLDVIDAFKNDMSIMLLSPQFEPSYNPVKYFNHGVKCCNGKFIILTNPEIFHRSNILGGLDIEFDKNCTAYVICSCQSANNSNKDAKSFDEFTYSSNEWYQHSYFNNRRLHFCSAIMKSMFVDIGMFDEKYFGGIAFDDDDLRENIINNNIHVVLKDELVTVHIEHSRSYQTSQMHLVKKNYYYYMSKWNKTWKKS